MWLAAIMNILMIIAPSIFAEYTQRTLATFELLYIVCMLSHARRDKHTQHAAPLQGYYIVIYCARECLLLIVRAVCAWNNN